MPELPDITVYVEHLARRAVGARLAAIRLASPFLLRSVTPSVDEVTGREVVAVRRLAKRGRAGRSRGPGWRVGRGPWKRRCCCALRVCW